MNRLPILKEITKLTETHCNYCEIAKLVDNFNHSQRHCLTVCEIGQKFQKLGKLLETKKKERIVKEPETRGRKVKYAHITKEMFMAELATNKTYSQIEESLGITRKSIRYLFILHGIEGRRGTHYQSITSSGVHQTRNS